MGPNPVSELCATTLLRRNDKIVHCPCQQASDEPPVPVQGVPQPRHLVLQPPCTVAQPLQTVQQPSHTVHTVSQPPHAVHLLPNMMTQHPHTVPQTPQTVPHPPHSAPHPAHAVPLPAPGVLQPAHAVPQPTQTAPVIPHHGSMEGSLHPSVVQFAVPPNFFPSSMLNSTLQTPLQHGVQPSLTASQSSTMSLLSALQDDKLGLILPVLVRMEHKIDQLMAMMGSKSNTGMTGLEIGNHLNATTVGSQSNATKVGSQSGAAAAAGHQSNATAMENQSGSTVVANRIHQDASVMENQSNSSTGTQRNATTNNQTNTNPARTNQTNVTSTSTPSNTSTLAPQSNTMAMAAQTTATTMESQSNTSSNDTTLKNQRVADTEMGSHPKALAPLSSFVLSNSLPGMTASQRIRLEMAKITEQTLPDDLNLPISRDELIALQAKSTSTMNFAVRLLRELFTREELIGRNISGVRGKDRVDPARIAVIKEIVFKIYRTSASDKELLWRYCHKAMDSFLRKMQRPIVIQDQESVP